MSRTIIGSSRMFVVGAVLMAAVFGVFTANALAQSDVEICPDFGDWVWDGSNWTLTGDDNFGSKKFDTTGDPQTVEICAPEGYLISGYCVKAGQNTSTVNVDPPMKCVDVVDPVEGKDVSHFSLKFVLDKEEEKGEWCSPGYWKNHPDEADSAAKACGLTMDAKYSSKFGSAPPLSPKGVRDGAPEEPTLRQVLDNPQWYGGSAANNVGDLLSECHPDVDFQGERVEDSCPLN